MHEFDISEPVEEMDEGDLRSTLDEFMEQHEENVADYREVESERDEYGEKVESLEDTVSEYSETEGTLADKFAEVVAAETDLFEPEEVADRFNLGELIEKADALGAFSLASEVPDEEPEDEAPDEGGSTFDEKPDRAPTGSGGSGAGGSFADAAESDLNNLLGLQ